VKSLLKVTDGKYKISFGGDFGKKLILGLRLSFSRLCVFSKQSKRQGGKKMKRFATFTVLLLLTMLLLAGTASANQTGAAWANSNRSGETAVVWDGGALLRNVPGQLTHTAFQLNTNSCASCHMTHTAVGTNLLIQASTQDTCMACHDGTIGFLNVNAAATGDTSGAGMGGSVAAGTFGVLTGRTPSMHDVFVPNTLSGAPGGNRTGVVEQAGASWTTNFTCASCHAPHGSHSIRLLNTNPNNVALRQIASASAGVAGGRWSPNARATGFTVASAAYDEARQLWVYPTVHAAAYTAPWVAGYTGSVSSTAYGRLSAPWTRIYHEAWNPNLNGRSDPTGTTAWVAADIVNLLNRYFTINFATGEVIQTETQRNDLISFLQNAPFNLTQAQAEEAPLNIDVARGLRVRAQALNPTGDLVADARRVDFINPATYDATSYNLFCAACHTDYLPTISAGNQTGSGVGIYSQKFRHTINRPASGGPVRMPVIGGTAFTAANLTGTVTGSNRLMCLSCHFAHGADASMMLLADNTRVSAAGGATGTPTDPAQNDVSAQLGGSSALKRYINQASCWHCHIRSSATVFHNSETFWTQFSNGLPW